MDICISYFYHHEKQKNIKLRTLNHHQGLFLDTLSILLGNTLKTLFINIILLLYAYPSDIQLLESHITRLCTIRTQLRFNLFASFLFYLYFQNTFFSM
jgi:hypothetical protein